MRVVETTDIDTCLQIRRMVFVEEQAVPETEEVDGLDENCMHFVLEANDTPIGTVRVLPKPDGEVKLQRVAVVPKARGKGAGAYLMREVLAMLTVRGFKRAVLGSQTQAISFYERLGFEAKGPEYLDAGIPHRDMERPL